MLAAVAAVVIVQCTVLVVRGYDSDMQPENNVVALLLSSSALCQDAVQQCCMLQHVSDWDVMIVAYGRC